MDSNILEYTREKSYRKTKGLDWQPGTDHPNATPGYQPYYIDGKIDSENCAVYLRNVADYRQRRCIVIGGDSRAGSDASRES